ncbi:3-oxoacyl-ACP reductase FabG [Blattabacterium cuenoti]|uniref:3-oxoacyl-ACP reductase FabG n=1 Tax=Blattabacterium cuenoti TaxID=1653831 RepID=UPI00163C6B4B|nr:3-oxoacyl-ACP reductase FabG [Blattabacterium cuenoti]
MKLLDNKISIVTGGSGDIGKSIVETFVKHGSYVIFTFFSSKKKAKVLEYNLKHHAESYNIDLSKNETSSKQLVEYVIHKYGKLDILVNNAGTTKDNYLIKISEKDWDYIMKINLYSIFHLTKYAIYPMIKQKKGSIINMSSIVGLIGNIGQSHYAASKAGIIGFTKSIAKEFGTRNIRCNTIAPGYISTNMSLHLKKKIQENWINKIPLKRAGSPQDIANCALFLASDLSDYITGSTLNVNGGII